MTVCNGAIQQTFKVYLRNEIVFTNNRISRTNFSLQQGTLTKKSALMPFFTLLLRQSFSSFGISVFVAIVKSKAVRRQFLKYITPPGDDLYLLIKMRPKFYCIFRLQYSKILKFLAAKF